MAELLKRKWLLWAVLFAGLFIQSCTRADIQFGENPENNYTTIVYSDTVSVSISTVLIDSFETNNASSLLLGKYKDPYLGTVAAKNFFQMAVPVNLATIPSSAQYDSLTFIFRPDNYYYGDTSGVQTFYVNELSQSITLGYNNKLYNTSSVPLKPVPLGSKTTRIRPASDDSVEIRLNDTKGIELFSKLRQSSEDVTNNDAFLQYFKGVSLSTGENDTTAIYGLAGTAGSLVMRVHYHTTIPYPEKKYIDFSSLANQYSFNQVLANRSGTGLNSGGNGITEIFASQTGNHSFMQPGTGIYLKMIFPSLRNMITTDKVIKLLKAELLIRPSYLSFDKNKYKLPSSIFLTQTDASNISGDEAYDSTGSTQYASPVIDELYGENNYYRFNITAYIDQLLKTPGSEDAGFFVMHNISSSAMNINRLVVNNPLHGNPNSKLLLSFIIINK